MELLFPLLIVALLVPMFLSVRKQRKEMAKTANLQDSLKVGDRVVTSSGVYGTIVEVDATTIDLEIAHDVVTTWLKLAIREVLSDEAEDADSDSDTAEEAPEDTERRLNQE
jgi:preprotein translocase subunit YajC